MLSLQLECAHEAIGFRSSPSRVPHDNLMLGDDRSDFNASGRPGQAPDAALDEEPIWRSMTSVRNSARHWRALQYRFFG
jgi:hypothetical protein